MPSPTPTCAWSRRRQDQTRGAGDWLAGEIDACVQGRGGGSQGRGVPGTANLLVGTNNTTLSGQQLGELNSQVVVARGQKADCRDPRQVIREISSRGEPIELSDVVNSDAMRRLSEQRGTLRAQLAEQSTRSLDGHPRIKELKAQINDLDNQIRAEAENLVRTSRTRRALPAPRSTRRAPISTWSRSRRSRPTSRTSSCAPSTARPRPQRDLLDSYLAKYRERPARDTIGSAAGCQIISRRDRINHAGLSQEAADGADCRLRRVRALGGVPP